MLKPIPFIINLNVTKIENFVCSNSIQQRNDYLNFQSFIIKLKNKRILWFKDLSFEITYSYKVGREIIIKKTSKIHWKIKLSILSIGRHSINILYTNLYMRTIFFILNFVNVKNFVHLWNFHFSIWHEIEDMMRIWVENVLSWVKLRVKGT